MKSFPRQAIILAAGLGTRLRPLTHSIPKPALPVGGVPILFFHLALLHQVGIRDIVINLHHRPQKIKDLLHQSKKWGLEIRYSFEPKILGTAGGIAQALAMMKNETTFVLNGDVLCDMDLAAMFRLHQRTRAKATLAAIDRRAAAIKSFIESDSQGRIWRIAGEPSSVSSPKKLQKSIFSGVHILEPELFRNYPSHSFGCVVRQIYHPALVQGERLQAYSHPGSWWDLGTLPQLTKIDALLYQNSLPRPILALWKRARFLHGHLV